MTPGVDEAPRFRGDADKVIRSRADTRSRDRILQHYVLERRLAEELRSASAANRAAVYGRVYAELFGSLPDHPQNARTQAMSARGVARQLRYIRRRLQPDDVFLELGCGDAAVAFAVAPHAKRSYGVDVTDALIDASKAPANFSFIRTEGADVPVPEGSVNLAYSNQLMEHLHPEDARDQLTAVRRSLAKGGVYVCTTPSRATGPHDISAFFDYTATGFHLQEYSYASLRQAFLDAGFKRVRFKAASRGHELPMPYGLGAALERGMLALPERLRGSLAQNRFVFALLGLFVIGEA